MRLNFLIRFLTTSRLTKGVTIVASTNNTAGAADHSRTRAISLSLAHAFSQETPQRKAQTARLPSNPKISSKP